MEAKFIGRWVPDKTEGYDAFMKGVGELMLISKTGRRLFNLLQECLMRLLKNTEIRKL